MTPAPGAGLGNVHERRLQVGPLAFTALEAGEGPLVLLIHGFPDGPETFSGQLPALAKAGFHAVAPTLRGYEASSRPSDGSYRVADLVGDVLGWMNALGAAEAHLIGHDWGATIAFAAAVAAPERVLSLSMLAVPHPARFAEVFRRDRSQQRRSSYIAFFQLRGLAEWWIGIDRAAFVRRIWRKWSPGWQPPLALLDPVRDRFADRGVRKSALSYYRQALDTQSAAGRQSRALLTGRICIPTLGVTGAWDGCISSEVFRAAMSDDDFALGVEVEEVMNAGHFVHQEEKEFVNRLLLAHLAKSHSSCSISGSCVRLH